jgi:hypothetical protein
MYSIIGHKSPRNISDGDISAALNVISTKKLRLAAFFAGFALNGTFVTDAS